VSGDEPSREIKLVEVRDERDPKAEAALRLIAAAFERPERQPLSELRSEIAEMRLGLRSATDFHLVVALGEDEVVQGTVAGMYLEGVNAGFVTYLTVDPAFRGRRLAPRLREALVERFRKDAKRAGLDDLAWVVGEVQGDSPWLEHLIRTHGAIIFDLGYRHPGVRPDSVPGGYVLYREPIGDHREVLPAHLVRRVLYAIYRRGYRIPYPLESMGFTAMLDEMEDRSTVGPAPLR
jgi:ribosomal protein S18 acetylase RimI-like enzyme